MITDYKTALVDGMMVDITPIAFDEIIHGDVIVHMFETDEVKFSTELGEFYPITHCWAGQVIRFTGNTNEWWGDVRSMSRVSGNEWEALGKVNGTVAEGIRIAARWHDGPEAGHTLYRVIPNVM